MIDASWAKERGLALQVLTAPLTAHALNGLPLASVSQVTALLSLTNGNHTEELVFYVLDSSFTSIVEGHPWQSLHNHHTLWAKNLVNNLPW